MTQQVKAKRTEHETRQWSLPDAASTAAAAINGAMQFCAQKMRLEDVQAVLEHLRQRNAAACNYCQYSIAKQVGGSLGALDQNVKAVYILDYDATPEDICFADEKQGILIHLIVLVERKTSALNSLVEALNHALAQHYARLLGMEKLEHLLDVQVVDAADVEKRIGYGAMLSSLHQRPIQIWKR